MDAETIAKGLTEAQRQAILEAFRASWGEWHVKSATRMDVRRRLIDKGILGKRCANPLLKLGLAVREALLRNAGEG